MATSTHSEAVHTGTVPWVNWAWVWKMTRWPILIFMIGMTVAYLPRVWGWRFHWIGTGHGSWSMASESGGVMPLSPYYTKKFPRYSVGDKISFEYKGNRDPRENGPSIKLVVAVNPDSSYRVAGMNLLNSLPPCNVHPKDIEGKIVAQLSPLPKAYWRWLSLGWSLTSDQIGMRGKRIFSLPTLVGVFTPEGRLRNWKVLRFAPGAVVDGGKGEYVVAEKTTKSFVVYRDRRLITPKPIWGESPGWEQDSVVFFRASRWDDEVWRWRNGAVTKIRDGRSVAAVGLQHGASGLNGEMIYFPVFGRWALRGNVGALMQLQGRTLRTADDHRVTSIEYRAEREGYGEGGITLLETTPRLPEGEQGRMSKLPCLLLN